MKFLVVEDDPRHLALMAAQLEQLGGTIDTAPTVARAIRLLRSSTRYDLVIVDRRLGDGDGFEVQQALKDLERPPPLLFVTSRASVDDAVAAMRAGAVGYVEKRPGYIASLEREVSRVLNPPRSEVAESRTAFEERERRKLVAALDRNAWNVSATARDLGIGRGKLRSRMASLGIDC